MKATTGQSVEKRIKNFSEVSSGISKKTAVEEARKFPQSADQGHKPLCPLGVDIPAFIRLLREGDIKEAFQKIQEQNALPSICGRLCLAPCEKSPIFENDKTLLGIRLLERFVADNGRRRFFQRKTYPTGKKVAVVGSGAAGLTAADFLNRKRYQVTVFESLPAAGGIMRYGIPEFRLPGNVLESVIEDLQQRGVVIKTNTHVGQTVSIDELFSQHYAAVLLTLGAGMPHLMDYPGLELSGVYYAQELLMPMRFVKSYLNRKKSPFALGRKIVIIGSGNEALDCARICIRLGKEAAIIFQEMEDDLAIHPQDIEYAKKEGVRLEGLLRPVEILPDENKSVIAVKCAKMDFADPDSSGQWRVVEVPDSFCFLDADTVIVAAGHRPNTILLKMISNLKFNEDDSLLVDPKNSMTTVKKIFAAGDLVINSHNILEAMVSGKTAADNIDRFLSYQ